MEDNKTPSRRGFSIGLVELIVSAVIGDALKGAIKALINDIWTTLTSQSSSNVPSTLETTSTPSTPILKPNTPKPLTTTIPTVTSTSKYVLFSWTQITAVASKDHGWAGKNFIPIIGTTYYIKVTPTKGKLDVYLIDPKTWRQVEGVEGNYKNYDRSPKYLRWTANITPILICGHTLSETATFNIEVILDKYGVE